MTTGRRPIEDDLELVEQFSTLGVRMMQLIYNIQNLVGGSCYEPSGSGLSRYGELVVGEMNRVRMLVNRWPGPVDRCWTWLVL